jgi:hypothetical protein
MIAPMSASTLITAALAAPAVPARATTRAPARARTRRKAKRPPRFAPRTPEDFFSPEAHALLTELLITQAQRWQGEGAPPIFYYGRESEPLWGEYAQHRCSGTTIRIAGRDILCECLCMDLERGVRLLTLEWTDAENLTADGHTLEAWRLALSGVFWRIGQLYREWVRRKGEASAQETLRLAMKTLWW